jgi:tRNA G26 N,N-dimethylase Trm1
VRAYQVSGLNSEGAVVVFTTTDTAGLAITRLQEARVRYLRAWVSDETGIDLAVPDLLARAEEERRSQRS